MNYVYMFIIGVPISSFVFVLGSARYAKKRNLQLQYGRFVILASVISISQSILIYLTDGSHNIVLYGMIFLMLGMAEYNVFSPIILNDRREKFNRYICGLIVIERLLVGIVLYFYIIKVLSF